MKPLTVVIPYSPAPLFEKYLLSFTKLIQVEEVIVVSQAPVHLKIPRCRARIAGSILSQETLRLILGEIQTPYLLLLPGTQHISIEPEALEMVLKKSESSKAGLLYSDFYEENERGKSIHPLNDYQLGSVRDDFDFGPMTLWSVFAVRNALKKYDPIPDLQFASLYDLRLKISIDHPIIHLQEPLYSVMESNNLPYREKMFAYVNPRNFTAQKEMETVFTDYLKKIHAYLPPSHLKEVEQTQESLPVEASIVIPVRNRKETIAEAVKSALSQEVDFSFNIIVVDNHSTDGTSVILANLARQYPRLKHIIPERVDFGIGGCWNEALRNDACGRYAVQLDSDDLYSSSRTLQILVDKLRQENFAMVIGSYTLVDSTQNEIPPGLIDHREWTNENGHNNALRINGLGAPRAFHAGLIRKIGFQNVSYGEDYEAALRICREYRIGRIFESLYLCRRWSGNTDAGLGIEERNRNDAFKDNIRTHEILARQKINQGK